jgi:excisionase family DNA binding protein
MGLAEQIEKLGHALSVDELAALLQLSDETIRRQVKQGTIPYFKVGMTIRFDPKQTAKWLREKAAGE